MLGAETAPTAELLRHAERNKVLLEFAERTHVAEIINAEKRKLQKVAEVAAEVHEALKGVDHLFIKLVKPVRYVPADVDVLTSHPKKAAAALARRGYKLVVKEPYTITLRKNGINVDLYLHPSVGNIVFLRVEQLRGDRREADFHGVRLPALKPPAEAALAIAHAVYKDGEVTLNDVVTYLRWREGTLEKCGEWKCLDAAGHFLAALHDVLTGRAPAPRPIPTWPLNAVKRALTHPDLAPSLLQAPQKAPRPPPLRVKLCLFGSDGSGKTTAAKILAAYLRWREVKVWISWMRGTHAVASLLARAMRRLGLKGTSNPYNGIDIPLTLYQLWWP